MAFDSSLDIFAAGALFTAAMTAWALSAPLPARSRIYLRFAAVLFSALAISVTLDMADVTAALLLPLASSALMIVSLARFAKPLPSFAASLALVVGLAGGLGAAVSGNAMPALIPVIFSGLAVIAASLNGIAVMPVLAGSGLVAAGLAFTEQGARAGLLLFCAAALIGLSKPGLAKPQLLRSTNRAARGLAARP